MEKNDKLVKMFAGIFRKQGFTVTEWVVIDVMEFESFYMKGMVLFDREKKRHRIEWMTKAKYEILDVPISNGKLSSEFKKPFDLLLFVQRRLMWRKR